MKSRGVNSRYSWVVAVACGLVFSLVNCPMRLGAQLFVSLKDSYGTTRDAASLPFELAYFTRSISGPLAGYIGQKIWLQKVTMIGCFIGATGIFASAFANRILTIDVCLGVIYGFGFGWATAVVPQIINQHFIEHRTKAIGFVFGASGLSGFLLPPLLMFLQNTYGESASFLIISGIILNTIPPAMLLTKPDEQRLSTSDDGLMNPKIPQDKMDDHKKSHKSNGVLDKSKENNFVTDSYSYILQTSTIEKDFSKDRIDNIILNPSFSSIQNSNSNYFSSNQRNEFGVTSKSDGVSKMAELNVKDLNNQLISMSEKSIYLKFDDNINYESKIEAKASTSMFESIDILWSPTFLLITFVQSSHFYIMYMFWTITVDVARDKGVERAAEVYFAMALSLFDTIGRFFLASVTDCTRITAAHFSSICFTLIGLACLLIVWVSGFEASLASICLLGLTIGGNTTSLPGIITGFIEKEKRSMAMASRLIMYAPMSFTMSPLIGYFREVLSSYNGLLYIMMSMCFACSIVLQILSKWHGK